MSSAAEISEIMANAKKLIEEKKAQLGIATQSEEKRATLMALKARIAASAQKLEELSEYAQLTPLEQLQLRQQTIEERERSLNLIIDSEGRTIDKRTGEVVQIQSRMPTLKANIKAQKRDYKTALGNDKDMFSSGIASTMSGMSSVFLGTKSIFKQSDDINNATPAASVVQNETVSEKFFDNRLKLKQANRNKRKLTFNDKGKYEDIANKLRTKTKLQFLQQEISSISKKTGISSDSRLALIQPKRISSKETIPNIEWWDFALLNEVNYDSLNKLSNDELKEKIKINRLIEHPVQMKPPTFTDKKVVPSVMLTAKERKKLRRQNRTEAMKEEQEKIRLGLMAPPEPKVKISNLMRVLGSEAVQDPTKVEEYVRNQMAKRQKMHEEQNAARKLTDAERAAKKKKKIMENTSSGVHVSVYKVKDLTDPSVKFKIEANCNQLHMTGVVILCKDVNVVVVEGGPKQQKKFKRLMINRIKWSEITGKRKDEMNDGIKEKNSCSLVWEGMVKNRCFGTIIFKTCPTATFAREYFKKFNCEHYYDTAQTAAILESSDL